MPKKSCEMKEREKKTKKYNKDLVMKKEDSVK